MAAPITLEEFKQYITGSKRHKCYAETVDLYTKLNQHANGETPVKLINERRPSESEAVLAYRKSIYVPMTKNPISKVISSLSKIRRSQDWAIKYDRKAIPASILPEETLESYAEKNYPEHGSVTNWVFSHLLKNYCIDANAVILVMPNNLDAGKNNEYYKPVATIFNSENVIYYEDGGSYAILKSTDKSDLIKNDGTFDYHSGNVYLLVTENEFFRFEETKGGAYQQTKYLKHNKGKLPVFKIKSVFLKQKDSYTVQESRLSPMIASLDEAAREYSDLQAAKVQHMFPLFWYLEIKECVSCNGIGKKPGESGQTACADCGSSGKIPFSPYAHIGVSLSTLGEKSIPFSQPAGYVQRDTDIIKHQDESVDKHIYKSLSSINMQFLDQTPLNISGEAKSVDREELNNFVYSVAEDLVWVMDKTYWWLNEWRYSLVVSDRRQRELMLPKIPVPEQFDLLPADYLMEEISKARTAKVNPILVAAMEQNYAAKKFYTAPELGSMVDSYFELDPLPGYSVDEKMSLLQNKGCTVTDFVISAYITSFVKRAAEEDSSFYGKPYSDKMAVIESFAKEKIEANDEAAKAKQDLLKEQQNALQ